MIYRVNSIESFKSVTKQDGKQFKSWTVFVSDSQGQTFKAQLATTPNQQIQLGEEFPGEITGEYQGVKKIRRLRSENGSGQPQGGQNQRQYATKREPLPYDKALSVFRRIKLDFDRSEDAVMFFLGYVRGEIAEPQGQPQVDPAAHGTPQAEDDILF